ncbi:MAG: Gfo/Idh/MocA family oxidoreductase [Saccharofermentanales bacterium]
MKIGFIDYFLDEWHANNYPAWLLEASDGEMQTAYAYAEIDSPNPEGLSTDEWCSKFGVERCFSIGEIVEKSDALIVLSPDNSEYHEKLSDLPLRSGKRTYIDKTFSPDKESAVRMFSLAKSFGTPCCSCSALRFAAEYKGLGADQNGESVAALSSWGPGLYDNYSVHQLEPLLMLMGGAPEEVCYIGNEASAQLTIRFSDGRIASMSQFIKGAPFIMQVCAAAGNRTIKLESDFFKEFMKELSGFFRTGIPIADPEETIRIMAVREAGSKAMRNPGTWVRI